MLALKLHSLVTGLNSIDGHPSGHETSPQKKTPDVVPYGLPGGVQLVLPVVS